MSYPVVPIRRVARLGSGHTPSRQHPEYWENCSIPWLTLADVGKLRDGSRMVIDDTEEMISEVGVANSAAVVHPAGTVALSRTASVGFTCVLGRDMATSQDFATWTCGSSLLPKFLLYALRADPSQIRERMTGSTHKTIYMPDIQTLEVPLPSIGQQREIVGFLDSELTRLEVTLQARGQQQLLLAERFGADARGCLTGGAAERSWSPGPTWLGPVPTSWRPLKIAWHKTTGSGTTPDTTERSYFDDGEVAWVTTAELRETLITRTSQHVSAKALRDLSALRVFPPGAVLIAMYGATIGRLGVLGIPAATNQACCAIYGEGDLDQRFLYWWLWAHRDDLVRQAKGAGQPNISQETIRSLRIPAPPIAEQVEIAKGLDVRWNSLDRTLRSLGRQQGLLHERKQALTTAAVTGQLDIAREIAQQAS